MTKVIVNLSEMEIKWVKLAGFSMLLDFRIVCYPHDLGYNIVEAFNSATYSLEIEAENIKISERIVLIVMDLSVVNYLVGCNSYRDAYPLWA